MLQRAIREVLELRLGRYPAVGLVGPRQTGKTTLARSLSDVYYDMEQEEDRLRLDLDWNRVFERQELVVLDEAQSWPPLFARLRGTIDQDRKRNGRVLLLGSVSPALIREISESLAGRMSVVELTPFLLSEVDDDSRGRLWLCGGYPDGGVLDESQFPQWQLDYLRLLAQRDFPEWGMPARPRVIERMMYMLAAVHGQIWNASQIGQSLGLSHNTINNYLGYFEGAFLARRLLPYQANIRKRWVKRPKFYWRDSGLLHALLRVERAEELLRKPWVGASWEGFVIDQVIGALASDDRRVDPFYFRTSDGYELDLVLCGARERWAIEIKLTSSPGPEDMWRLNKAADLIEADKRILVSHVDAASDNGSQVSCDLPYLLNLLQKDGHLL